MTTMWMKCAAVAGVLMATALVAAPVAGAHTSDGSGGTADFTYSVSGREVFFQDASSLTSGDCDPLANVFSWDFGDGTSTANEEFNYSHVYPGPGSYDVTHGAGFAGCEAFPTITTTIVVPATCKGLTATIDLQSDDSGVTVTGTPGLDVIVTGNGDDVINGLGGDDVICSQSGNDFIQGGAGSDQVFGGNGDDTAKGSTGDDQVFGGNGNDSVDGGDGRDVLRGQDGNDKLNGGNGDDTVIGGAGNDALSGNAGADTCAGDYNGSTAAGTDKVTANGGCETAVEVP
jgi:Ca2+-binding RTX toxin-like protein